MVLTEFAVGRVRDACLQHIGIDILDYRPEHALPRLEALAAVQPHGLDDLCASLANDPAMRAEVTAALTVATSQFFRDPVRFDFLRRQILPGLVREGAPLRVWSAGCGDGAEPFSLAMLVCSGSPDVRCTVLGTDIHAPALRRARAGGPYNRSHLASEAPWLPERDLRWNRLGGTVPDALRARVDFARHDLLRDPPPGKFNFIAARNVLIYFSDDARRRALEKLHSALVPGGVLFLGESEVPDRTLSGRLEPLAPCFYARLDAGVAVAA